MDNNNLLKIYQRLTATVKYGSLIPFVFNNESLLNYIRVENQKCEKLQIPN